MFLTVVETATSSQRGLGRGAGPAVQARKRTVIRCSFELSQVATTKLEGVANLSICELRKRVQWVLVHVRAVASFRLDSLLQGDCNITVGRSDLTSRPHTASSRVNIGRGPVDLRAVHNKDAPNMC
ncbi:hypothetical protein LIA77_11300 [Sarocladium implicatum]|nr:hypothetical protein LIA77_11300 [Sarocladium implicatum]